MHPTQTLRAGKTTCKIRATRPCQGKIASNADPASWQDDLQDPRNPAQPGRAKVKLYPTQKRSLESSSAAQPGNARVYPAQIDSCYSSVRGKSLESSSVCR